MQHKLILCLFSIIILMAPSCKKEHLTKETQTGANTFSCKINGNVFTPCKGGLFSGPPLWGGYSNNFKTVVIAGECTLEYPFKYVVIDLENFHGVGEYLLSDINNSCTYLESNPTDKYYKSSLTQNGKVVITKDDRVNFIVSGTFEFTAANTSNSSDIVTVLSGRFDIKFI